MMNSFVQLHSQDILPLCQMAKTVIQLEFNRKKKDYEERLEKYKPWDRMSWREKWQWLYDPQSFPSGPERHELYLAEDRLDKQARKIKIIEIACMSAETVYLSFDDLEFLKNLQNI